MLKGGFVNGMGEWTLGMSISLRQCQSGQAEEMARSLTAWLEWMEGLDGRSNICSTSASKVELDARKAAGSL